MKLRACFLCVFVVSLIGCESDPGELSAPWQSGTRIRARVAVAPDGFTYRVDWRDTALDLDCVSFDSQQPFCGAARASDTFFYTDEQCTQPAVLLDVPQTNTGYAIHGGRDDLRLFRIPTSGGPFTFFTLDNGNCWPSDGLEEVYPILEELPLDTLARWHPVTDFGDAVTAFTTDDGALDVVSVAGGTRETDDADTRLRQVTERNRRAVAAVGIFDSLMSHDCALRPTAGGPTRCFPAAPAFRFGAWRDPQCQDHVWASPIPGFYFDSTEAGVTTVEQFDTPDSTLYTRDGVTTCTRLTETRYVASGTVALTDFEAVELALE